MAGGEPVSADAAANKAAGARILVAGLLFALGELRRADPDAAEAERERAVRMLGGDRRPRPSRVDSAAVARALAEANAETGLFGKGKGHV